MNKNAFLTNVILLALPLLFFCQQTCLEEERNNKKHSICDTEKNLIKNWIKKVSSKEYLKEDSPLAPIDSCQGDIRGEALSCSWGRCDEEHTGLGQVTLPGGRHLAGEWTHGQLSGWVTQGEEEEETLLYHNNCPQHGLVTLETEAWTIVTSRDPTSGLVSGPAWLLYSHGEGGLYTEVSEDTGASSLSLALFTGEAVTWLYPDLSTSLQGHFVAGTMLEAWEAELTSVSMSDSGVPKITVRRIQNSEVYKFDPSTDVHLSSSPLMRDPYEKELLDVKESGVSGAGMGVFARRNLDNNTIVGYFNGVHRDRAEVLSSSGKKSVYLVEGTWEGEMLDIPEQFQSWASYQASAGHLINHDTAGNVDYTECRHPRFGHILCVVATRKIAAGKELFVKYDVAVDEAKVKFALKTALQFGQIISGKSKKEFVREIKPYMKIVSDLSKHIKLADFIRF